MEKNSIPRGCFSFLKLLNDENYTKEIQIADSFVRKHSKKLSRRYILLDTQAEVSWSVKIQRRGPENHHNYYMCEGEWSHFVKFYDLKHGDYLLFFMIDDTVFKVIPYGADCCQKMSSYSYNNVFRKSSSRDDDSWDDDDDDDDADADADADDDNDSSSVNHCTEENDQMIHKGRHKIDARRCQPNKKIKVEPLETGPSSRCHNFKKSSPLDFSSRSKPGRRAFIDLNAKNPFCEVTIKRHNRRFMTVPKAFAKKTQIVEKENVILRGKDKRQWVVGIEHTEDGRVNMASGWQDFYRGYGLEEGDSCKFTHLMNKGSKNTLLVEITREIHP